MFLTKQGGIFVKPISIVLGEIINLIYNMLSKFGVVNIGITIILFTLLVRLCMLPSQFKQNRSSKVMNYIQPEINKATKKYKNKRDQESMMALQRETKAIQDKYGVNTAKGCLTSLIQLPIFLAVYNIVSNIPAYVDKVKNLYQPIADAIMKDPAAIENLKKIKEETSSLGVVKLDATNVNSIIDVLAKFSVDTWDKFTAMFNNQGVVVDEINANVGEIEDIYSFAGGINLMSAPGFAITAALIIPILSLIFQFLSTHASMKNQPVSDDPAQQATMKSMRMMMNIFPIMSFFITVNVPAGVGLYWATGSFIAFMNTIIINAYFKNCDMEKIIEKSKEQAAIKLAKREAKGKKSLYDRLQEAAYGEQNAQASVNKGLASKSNLKSYSSNNSGNAKYREGSLAAKANAMQRYNNGGNK